MKTPFDQRDSTLTLTIEPEHFLVPWLHAEPRHADANGSPTRAIRCSTDMGTVLAHPARLPFASDAFRAVRLFDQLEHVRLEEDLLAEIGRVLRPGGRLLMRVPAVGPLAGFDAMNLTRYLIDITRFGRRPIETSELGWRKHYSEGDIAMMLKAAGMTVVATSRSRFIISELLEFGARALLHWAGDNMAAFDRTNAKIDRIRRLEDHIRFKGGFLITVEAVKPPAPEPSKE